MTPKDVLKKQMLYFFVLNGKGVNKYIIQYREIATKEICLGK